MIFVADSVVKTTSIKKSYTKCNGFDAKMTMEETR